jgi:hypothetical protein
MTSISNTSPMLLAIVVRSCLLKRRSFISRNCTLRVYESVSFVLGAFGLN